MRQAAVGFVALAAILTSPAAGLTWRVTNPDPSLAGAGVVPIGVWGDELQIEIHKWWRQTLLEEEGTGGGVPLVIQFVKEAQDPDILHIIDEFILNVSEQDWVDYHVWLLDGTGLPVQPSDPTPPVWFFHHQGTDNWQVMGGAHRFAKKHVTLVVADPSKAVAFDWSDGLVPAGDWFGPQGPPYNQLVLTHLYIDMSDIPVGGGFYLKQLPTIPEPVTALLLAAAGLVAGLRRRRGALRG